MLVSVRKIRVNWTAIRRVANRGEPVIRRALLRAITGLRNGTRIAEVQRALNRGDLTGAVDAVPWQRLDDPELRAALMNGLRDTFEAAGIRAPSVTPSLPRTPFDVLNPRGLAVIRERGGALITQLTETTRAGVRISLETMLREGLSAQQTAALIRPQIGLFDRWATAVANHRTQLLSRGVPHTQVVAETERYSRQLVQARALMIARTEAAAAVNAGVQEYWEQSADAGMFDRGEASREWVAVLDNEGTCNCEEYHGMTVGFDENFPEGDPPIHPNCLCDVLLWPAGKD